MELLRFKVGNAKLSNTLIFSLPAGHACPAAVLCKSKSDRKSGRVTDGPETEYRCFGASCEARSPSLRRMVWRNFDLLKEALKGGATSVADLLDASMPDWNGLVRIHSTGGDFFHPDYLKGWLELARRREGQVVKVGDKAGVVGTVFYCYTKMLPYFKGVELPSNFHVVASVGGKYDKHIDASGMRKAYVVMSEAEASEMLGVPVDHDDTHAWNYDGDFALIVHGTQPAKSRAAKAREANRKAGKFTGYSKGVAR